MGCLVVFSTVVSRCTTNGFVTQYAINSAIAKPERNQPGLSKLVGRRWQGERVFSLWCSSWLQLVFSQAIGPKGRVCCWSQRVSLPNTRLRVWAVVCFLAKAIRSPRLSVFKLSARLLMEELRGKKVYVRAWICSPGAWSVPIRGLL